MPDILLSSTSSDARSALSQCDLANSTLFNRGCQPASSVQAYSPYLVGERPSLQDQAILGELAAGDASRRLTEMGLCFGSAQVNNLAELREQASAVGVGSIGTATSVYMDRINLFAKALEDYQGSLLAYRDAARSGSPLQVSKRLEVRRAFERLQTRFQSELKVIASRNASRRGTPITRAERGINIARSSRHAEKLYVADQAQAHKLVKFTRHAKILGIGLAAIDFGGRIGKVHTSYAAGDTWHREMFIQSASFTAGGVVSIAGVKGGLALLAVFTPAGLVGLIVGGLAIAGVTTAGAYFAGDRVQARAGGWYDAIMEWLGSL